MNKELAVTQGEKYLNQCFKNLGITNLEEIVIKEEEGKITFEGDRNMLASAFENSEEAEIRENEIIINEENIDDLKEVVKELNIKIQDFNIYAKKRVPLSFF